MDYHVALSPDLDVNAPDLVTLWNDTPECRTLAEAQVSIQPPQGFSLDPAMVQRGIIVLTAVGGMVGGLALDALKDTVKEKLTAYLEKMLSRKPSIKVDAIRQPGGAYLLVVAAEGE